MGSAGCTRPMPRAPRLPAVVGINLVCSVRQSALLALVAGTTFHAHTIMTAALNYAYCDTRATSTTAESCLLALFACAPLRWCGGLSTLFRLHSVLIRRGIPFQSARTRVRSRFVTLTQRVVFWTRYHHTSCTQTTIEPPVKQIALPMWAVLLLALRCATRGHCQRGIMRCCRCRAGSGAPPYACLRMHACVCMLCTRALAWGIISRTYLPIANICCLFFLAVDARCVRPLAL